MNAEHEVRLAVAALPESVRPRVVWWLHAQADVFGSGPTERLLRAVARMVDEREVLEVAMVANAEMALSPPPIDPTAGPTDPGARRRGTVLYDQDLEVVGFVDPVTGDGYDER